MGACRQGYDLFTKIGLRCWFDAGLFGDKWARRWVLMDTFGHHICAVVGHSKKTFETDDRPPETVCCRCNRIIKAPTP